MISQHHRVTKLQGHRVTKRQENQIGSLIVDRTVHWQQDLGTGLRGTGYEVTRAAKLGKQGLSVERQVPLSIEWEGSKFDDRFRADLIVARNGVVEFKSVRKVDPAHKQQGLTYLA